MAREVGQLVDVDAVVDDVDALRGDAREAGDVVHVREGVGPDDVGAARHLDRASVLAQQVVGDDRHRRDDLR
jgi:hypothetical protein